MLDTKIYYHPGNNDGFTCWYGLDTEKDWGFVLLTNSPFGEILGEDLFFYLFLGPYFPLIVISSIVVILIGIGYLVWRIIRRLKNKRSLLMNMKS